MLGVSPEAACPQQVLTLDEDAALVVVTDGVVEGPGLTLETGLEHAGTVAARAFVTD
ncbi:SpoIIE family protein phosphatase [Streptomyces sp. NBC_01471]|uniref:SpoIIE family protein phosphatase n=1 Tax=Streptomyces sp. NBC_01471 TaxID=2903879 RepID=UPI00352E98BE